MFRQLLATSLLSVFLLAGATAQSLQTVAEYRVTAYKRGDVQVKSVSNDIEMLQSFNLYIPNTFTPNGDELNDTFGAVARRLSTYSMLIFNKWGQLIYETDDIDAPWDGTYDGQLVQEDSYVYKITATGTEMGNISKNGTVTLIL